LQQLANSKTLFEGQEHTTQFLKKLEASVARVGDEENSLSGSIECFFTALQSPIETQKPKAFFRSLVHDAQNITQEFERLSSLIQHLRSKVHKKIVSITERINALLKELSELNDKIGSLPKGSDRAFAFIDRRDAVFLELSTFLLVTQTPKEFCCVPDPRVMRLWGPDGNGIEAYDRGD
jgi:flagellar hook-associated protein FlgK